MNTFSATKVTAAHRASFRYAQEPMVAVKTQINFLDQKPANWYLRVGAVI